MDQASVYLDLRMPVPVLAPPPPPLLLRLAPPLERQPLSTSRGRMQTYDRIPSSSCLAVARRMGMARPFRVQRIERVFMPLLGFHMRERSVFFQCVWGCMIQGLGFWGLGSAPARRRNQETPPPCNRPPLCIETNSRQQRWRTIPSIGAENVQSRIGATDLCSGSS
jgi:hypothetical protein